MNRPTTIRGLLWRLARLHPRRSLAVAVGVAVLVRIVASHRTRDHGEAEECPLEQTWFQGDMHYSQELVFSHDGKGVWTTGGMSDDAPHKRMNFRWQSNGSRLTVVSSGARRTVDY